MTGLRAGCLWIVVVAMVGCGSDDGGGADPVPCAGACPVAQCIAGQCLVPRDTGGDDDTDEALDAPDAAAPDADAHTPDIPEGCLSDRRCGVGSICDALLDPPMCRPGCRADGDCDPGLYCEAEGSICADGCRDDAACPGNMVCNLESRACQAPTCAGDDDCPEPSYCAGMSCMLGCRVGGCGQGQYCPQDTRTCTAGCADDTGCEPSQWCNENVCEVGCRDDDGCPDAQQCVSLDDDDRVTRLCLPERCRRDSDCQPGLYCGEGAFDRPVCVEGCRLLGDCAEPFVCDPQSRLCVAPTCVDDVACAGAEVCVDAACRFGCRDDAACADGQLCEPDALTCTCATSADCGGGVCVQDLCAAACDSDDRCPAPATCDEETGACSVGCIDDLYEPNNEFLDAVDIGPGLLPGLRMCYSAAPAQDAQDCFQFELDIGVAVRIDALFDSQRGDLDFAVYDPTFTVVGASLEMAPPVLEFDAALPGLYRLCVLPGGEPPLRLQYTLDVQF